MRWWPLADLSPMTLSPSVAATEIVTVAVAVAEALVEAAVRGSDRGSYLGSHHLHCAITEMFLYIGYLVGRSVVGGQRWEERKVTKGTRE